MSCEPRRFRRRPLVVEATQINTADSAETLAVADWCDGQIVGRGNKAVITVDTLEGPLRARDGDWIVKGIAGEFHPCKPDIFEATYDEVLDDIDARHLEEWADAVMVTLDGARCAGWEPREVIDAIKSRQAGSEDCSRVNWRAATPDRTVEHIGETEQT